MQISENENRPNAGKEANEEQADAACGCACILSVVS